MPSCHCCILYPALPHRTENLISLLEGVRGASLLCEQSNAIRSFDLLHGSSIFHAPITSLSLGAIRVQNQGETVDTLSKLIFAISSNSIPVWTLTFALFNNQFGQNSKVRKKIDKVDDNSQLMV